MSTISGLLKCKVEWHLENKRLFVNAMLEVQRKSGSSSDSGFKTAQWTEILNIFGQASGTKYDRQQLQSQQADMKKKYSKLKAVIDNSGFDWDSESNMPTAPVATWDAYLAANPQAKMFRTEPLHMYEELNELFGGKKPNEHSTSSSSSIPTSSSTSNDSTLAVVRKKIEDETSSTSQEEIDLLISVQKKTFTDSSVANIEDEIVGPVSKVARKLVNKNPDDLMAVLNRLVEVIAANGYPSPVTAVSNEIDALQKAIKILTEEHCSNLDAESSMLLKMSFFENPVHSNLFLTLTNDERVAYIKSRLRFLKRSFEH